jgi:putative membrane-bound dehydrogenase-like protein
MKRLIFSAAALFLCAVTSFAAEPLRVFIRSGPKSHGPGAHDYPQFLKDWIPLLNERGMKASGKEGFPTKEELDATDVLILHAQEAGNIKIGEERKNLLEFLKRGGGLVVIHAAAVSRDHDWFKNIIGGSWHFGQTKWLEGPMHLYFTDRDNPITKDCSNWAMDDEIYYDMDVLPEARILAGAYTPKPAGARNEKANKRAEELTQGGKTVSVYDIQPQMWTYEKDNYRAFVSIPGHYYKSFNRPNYRAILLRGIAWAGKRADADEFLKPEERGDNLRYVEGGPVRPEKAHEQLEVHPEFDLSLVASEPLINKAMNVDWDEKGRLWVCETPEYPNGRRVPNVDPWKDSGSLLPYKQERDPQDRISILTDSDGDGRMDKKHVFADKLELVTSFCFHKNGVIACSAPDIWFLEDTNGDEVADKRTKLYTGLGIGDTHAVINNLRWGLDGWVYATHGYSAGDVTCLGPNAPKEPVRIASGVIRFKPDGSAIEMYSSRGGNTWGLDITWDGQVFWTQPTSGTVLFHTVLPEYVLAKGKIPGTNSWKGLIEHQKTFPLMTWKEQAYVQIDLVGEFTAAAGCAIYEGGAWPEKWNYSYFTTEPTLNIVHHEFVTQDGVSYKAAKEKGREETEFIRSKDLWFRPIETRIGPDGALYVIDFYNQAVIHNDTRGPIHGPANAAIRPDRDHYFGRIWKVQHKEAKKLETVKLDKTDGKALDQIIRTEGNAHVKKQAWRLLTENHEPAAISTEISLKRRMGSMALRGYERREGDLENILPVFANHEDAWTRSAMIAAASSEPLAAIRAAVNSDTPDEFKLLVEALIPSALEKESGNGIRQLIEACAGADAKANALKVTILQALAQSNGRDNSVSKDPKALAALKTLLSQPATAGAALPLVAVLGQESPLTAQAIEVQVGLVKVLNGNEASDEEKLRAARALLQLPVGVQHQDTYPAVNRLLGSRNAGRLERELIALMGDTPDNEGVEYLTTYFAGLAAGLKPLAFDQIIKRPESSLALLSAIADGKISPADLGPGNVARLRTHPNKNVARRAAEMMEKLNPNAKAKNEIIARLAPEVERAGNVANGKAMFTAACAVCHKFGDVGVRDVGPPLAGMGAHGPAELLVHIVDPNREVDPSFWQWNITTKKGETLAGIIATENQGGLTLRNQTGDYEIKAADIATRENTRRSLMPEGLDALGAEVLRDILAFICGADQKYRVLDLRDAYTADSRRGAFRDEEAKDETVTLHKFGNVTVHGVPFFVMDPVKSVTGSNLIMLKGGGKGTAAAEFPQRVEIPTHATAASLHFLGGVAGWGWPFGGEGAKGKPAMKVTVEYAEGDKEEFTLNNGEHFADYIGQAEVPMSQSAGDFTRRGQLRYFALNLKKKAPLKSIILESFDNGITPATVAITASAEKAVTASGASANNQAPNAGPKEGGKGDGPLPAAKKAAWEAGKTKVLIIGGGSSHNFGKFFGDTDGATLTAAGFSVHYTEDRDQAAAELKNADVAVISVNRRFFDIPAYRKALMDFADAGKGIIMLHPGTWYGFAQWPELNAKIVGGGARGHDKIHPFEVKALKPEHPILKGVPPTFTVEDELYYVNAESDKIPQGTAPIEVLAETSPSDKYQRPHPSVWVTRHEKARIVGIALGHDERVHDHPAFRTLLANAVEWAAKK